MERSSLCSKKPTYDAELLLSLDSESNPSLSHRRRGECPQENLIDEGEIVIIAGK